jgi:hypothetical protein
MASKLEEIMKKKKDGNVDTIKVDHTEKVTYTPSEEEELIDYYAHLVDEQKRIEGEIEKVKLKLKQYLDKGFDKLESQDFKIMMRYNTRMGVKPETLKAMLEEKGKGNLFESVVKVTVDRTKLKALAPTFISKQDIEGIEEPLTEYPSYRVIKKGDTA